jgi:hypothetical protein
MSKDTFYFSHDAGARNDEKILAIRAEFEWEGYGWYFSICELFRESSDYTLSHDVAMLRLALGVDKAILFEKFMKKCFDVGLFRICADNSKRFYSESFMNRMARIDEKHKRLAEAGRKGGEANALKLKEISSHAIAKPKHRSSNEIKENEIKENEIKENQATIPPHELLFFIKNLSFVSKLKTQPTNEQCELLIKNWGKDAVIEILEAMENTKNLCARYNSTYLTANNWLKKREENSKQKTNGKQSLTHEQLKEEAGKLLAGQGH